MSNPTPGTDSGAVIAEWRPEDESFWQSTGSKIAYRNLWLSIPALFCAFAVWSMWGIITVQMYNLGFPFTQAELFTLTAIAGISGATIMGDGRVALILDVSAVIESARTAQQAIAVAASAQAI